MRTFFILAGLGVAAVLGGACFVYAGIYNPAATVQHTAPVYWLLNVAMRQAVQRHASEIRVPPLNDRPLLARGGQLYRAHCVQCHGAPGVAPDAFALGMTPLPANLALTARAWKDPAELYWVVRYGIKMSGMPAWEFRLVDADLWAVTGFVDMLPQLSPGDYQAAVATAAPVAAVANITSNAATPEPTPASSATGGPADSARGKIALQQYACVSCHVIPGVVAANNPVGPSLAAIGSRKYLAGVLPNTSDNMVRWLRAPQQVAPNTAMPDLGVTQADARDMAAFLETLK